MDLTVLESPLREQVRAYLDVHPKSTALVTRMLEKRAVAASSAERDRIDKRIAWMITPSKHSGWIFGGLLLSVAAVAMGYTVWSERRLAANVENGEPVVAKVTRLESGNCTIEQKGNKCLQLELELHPLGRPVYAGSVTHDLPLQWASRVQPGSWITVAVDRTDPNKVHFDEKSMEVEPPKPLP